MFDWLGLIGGMMFCFCMIVVDGLVWKGWLGIRVVLGKCVGCLSVKIIFGNLLCCWWYLCFLICDIVGGGCDW